MQPNEVMSYRYVSKQELQELLATADANNIQITPWFRLIAESFLYKWWDILDSLQTQVDEHTIHRMFED